jgi:hypothetical protein
MRKNNCELIRRELDELMLDEQWSAMATAHLKECDDCREFHEQQTKLRRIVGGLGTVEAPADFDFRLRARLANQSNGMSYFYWPLVRRALAAAAILVVFATGALLVRNIINRTPKVEQIADKPKVVQPEEPRVVKTADEPVAPLAENTPPRIIRKGERPSAIESKKRPMATNDFSSERAPLYGTQPVGVSAAFPIDAAPQPFKVSVDDGRGNARTISVPTISFGSQRIVQNANQFAPKRVW